MRRSATGRRRRVILLEPIRLGKLRQNAYVERYNRSVRYGWLSQPSFDIIGEFAGAATRWFWTYNHERRNMVICGVIPMQKLAMAA